MRARLSLAVAFVPALALVGGLPFVNRLEPVVLGLPFLLSWILAWVLATPIFLAAAYLLAGRDSGQGRSEAPGHAAGGAKR
jgi:hypothetical protein